MLADNTPEIFSSPVTIFETTLDELRRDTRQPHSPAREVISENLKIDFSYTDFSEVIFKADSTCNGDHREEEAVQTASTGCRWR